MNHETREADCRGHKKFRDGRWELCHFCDYLEPIAMTHIPEND